MTLSRIFQTLFLVAPLAMGAACGGGSASIEPTSSYVAETGSVSVAPARNVTEVQAGATDQYQIIFAGDKTARVMVKGDGDTDLDLYVYDDDGKLVGSDADSTDTCIVSFTPATTSRYTVRVRNRGGVYNRYLLWAI